MSHPIATNPQGNEARVVRDPASGLLSRAHLWSALPVLAIILTGVAGHATSTLKPLIIQAFVHSLGLDKATSGYLLTTEMVATSIGTIFATAFPIALRRRGHLFGALASMMVANLLSILFKHDVGPLLYGLRCISGIGAGFGLGRLAVLIALSARPGRTASLYSVTTQVYGAAAAFAMPLIDRFCGDNSIFVILAGTVPLALVLIKFLPEDHVRTPKVKTISALEPVKLRLIEKLILAASFAIFYLGVGTFWPFISVLGESAGVGSTHMSAVLGWASVVSALGSVTAIFAGDRQKSAPILCLFFAGLCLSILLQQAFRHSYFVFVASVLLFAYTYWVVNPLILGMMSKLDTTGQMNGVYYILAVGGIALGPALAGWILTHESDRLVSATLLRSISVTLLASASAVQGYYAYRARRLPA